MKYQSWRYSGHTFKFILVLVLSFITLQLRGGHASALAVAGDSIPDTVKSSLLDMCTSTGNYVAQSAWLSLRDQPLSTSTVVANGVATNLQLQWNIVVMQCPYQPVNSVFLTNYQIVGTSPNIPGMLGQVRGISYAGTNWDPPARRAYSVESVPFSYSVTLTASQFLTLTVNDKKINVFPPDGNLICVRRPTFVGPADRIPSNVNDFQACRDNGVASASILVSVSGKPAPTLTIGNTCSGITASSNGLRIDVYRDSVIPTNGLGQVANGEFDLAAAGLSPGQVIQVAAIGDDINTEGNRVEPWTWRLPSNCNFSLQPVPGLPQLDDDEDPRSVSYRGAVNLAPGSSVRSVPGVEVVTDFYIVRNGIIRPNQPITGAALTNQTIRSGYVVNAGPAGLSGLRAGDEVCWTIKATPSSGTVDSSGNVIIASPAPSATSAPACKPVVDRPYLNFLGGDVATGGDFEGAASCSGSGGIRTYRKGTTGFGSGVAFAAMLFGMGTVDTATDFATGMAQNPADAGSLVFAKPNGEFEGSHCIKDYFSDYLAPGVTDKSGVTSINIIDLSTAAWGSGNYRLPGGLTLGGDLPNNVRARLYVDGDLYITDSIRYVNANWPDVLAIPSLHVYVKGNIYIEADVTELVGMFVAQPKKDGSGAPIANTGEIVTCSGSSGAVIAATALYGTCSSPLKVKGAFIANKVKWLRTANSLRNGSVADRTLAGSQAAETVELTPEFLMVAPPEVVPGNLPRFQFYTTLPPVL